MSKVLNLVCVDWWWVFVVRVCASMCMCLCVSVCMCLCVSVCMCLCVCVFVHLCVCVCVEPKIWCVCGLMVGIMLCVWLESGSSGSICLSSEYSLCPGELLQFVSNGSNFLFEEIGIHLP